MKRFLFLFFLIFIGGIFVSCGRGNEYIPVVIEIPEVPENSGYSEITEDENDDDSYDRIDDDYFFNFFSVEELDILPHEPYIPEYIPRRPMISLTFDDGPSQYTPLILDMLQSYGGRATFFVLGNRVAGRPEIVSRIINDGHEIMGHSWDHQNFLHLNRQQIYNQIVNTSNVIYEVTGVRPPSAFRAPFGLINELTRDVSRELGYAIIRWSVDPEDWRRPQNADNIYNHIMSHAVDGAIVLLHDIHPTTVEAMYRVIPSLIAKGFDLVTTSELLEYFFGELVSGAQYDGMTPTREEIYNNINSSSHVYNYEAYEIYETEASEYAQS